MMQEDGPCKCGTETHARQGRETREGRDCWRSRPIFKIGGHNAYVIIIQNAVESACGPWGAAVRPNASACVSKHCVPVHTVLRCSVSMTSCTPGLCAPFWQTQFIRSSQLGMVLSGREEEETGGKDREAAKVSRIWPRQLARAPQGGAVPHKEM